MLDRRRRDFRQFHGGFIEIHAEETVQLAPVAVSVGARDQADDGFELLLFAKV